MRKNKYDTHNLLKYMQVCLMLTCMCISTYAQGIKGKVVDTNKNVIIGATVILQDKDSVIIDACSTDTCGLFSFTKAPSPYILIVSHLAYNASIRVDTVQNINITLQDYVNKLNEVNVIGSIPMQVNKYGALQFSSKSLTEKKIVRNALEMLDEVPTLQRTGNDFSIIGSSSFDILINGHKNGMSKEQALSFLSSIMPDQVQHIEVFYNTPAKYGVKGASVNVVLTEKRTDSLQKSGSIYGGFTQRTHISGNGGVSLNLSAQNYGINLGYSGDYQTKEKILSLSSNHKYSENEYNIIQNDINNVSTFDNNAYLDFNWDCNKNSSFTFSYIMQTEKPNTKSSAKTFINESLTESNSKTNNSTWLHNIEASYSYNEMEFGINALFYNQNNQQELVNTDNSGLMGNYKQNHSKYGLFFDNEIDLWNGQLNYGINSNFTFTSSNNELNTFGNYNDNTQMFSQSEQSICTYIGFRHNISNKGLINISLEGEYFHSSYKKNTSPKVQLWREFELYPSLTLTYKPSLKHIIQLTFNSNKIYPTYWTTAASRTFLNSYCQTEGNTLLKPYTKYSFNINYIINSLYIFGIFAEKSPNYFTQLLTLSTSELTAIYKYYNIKNNYRYGIMAVIPHKWSNNFQSKLTSTIFDMHQNGKIAENISFSKRKFSSMFKLSNNIDFFDKKLIWELSGWYQSPIIQGCYDVPCMYSVSTGITWQTPLSGLSITFKGEDLFNTYRMKTNCNIDKMSYSFTNNIDMQSFSLTIKYDFNKYKEHKTKTIDSTRFGL